MEAARLASAYPGLRQSDIDHLMRLWSAFEPYADHQFSEEILSDLHSRFWEMYLGCTLLECGHQLVPSKNRPNEGPDLCLMLESGRVWIEATAPDYGTGPDAVPELPCGDGQAHRVPDEELTLRYRAAFYDKQKAFRRYRQKGLVAENDRCVIAISGGRFLGRVWTEAFLPRIVQALYPIGPYAVTLDSKTAKVVDEGHTYRDQLTKSSGGQVHTDVFLNPADGDICCVIFSYADVWNRPEVIGKDFVVCHHKSPTHPLPKGWLPRGTEYWPEADQLQSREW